MDSYANWAEMGCGAHIYTRVARDWCEELHVKFPTVSVGDNTRCLSLYIFYPYVHLDN